MPARTYRSQAEKTPLDRLMARFAQSRLGGLLFITVFPAIDKRLMPLTRGHLKIGMSQPVLLLHARGAKSAQPRTVPLLYTPRGEDFLLVASKDGAVKHPSWFHNLKAHPDVEVEVDGQRIPVSAREADGAEREELWRLVTDNYDGYDVYQQRAAGRRIPVMVLSPR